MKRRPQILLAVTAWLAGLVIAALWILRLDLFAVGILAALAVAVLIKVRSRLGYVLIVVAFLCLGLLRGQMYAAQQAQWSVENLIGQKVSVIGRIVSEPSWNDDRLHEFYIDGITIDGRSVPGMMKIKALIGSSREGQVIRVTGKVGHALGRAPTQIWYAKVELVDDRLPYPVRLKNLLGSGLSTAMPREPAGLVRGLLFGTSAAVSAETEASLRAVGLTHIIAVSGYNLTIIVAALTVFSRRRSRNACLLALGGIVFFVIMTGAPASIVRAGVMAGIFLLVGYYRRDLDPGIGLAATVVVMTAWSPSYLYTDIGWQLSVLALSGVLWIAPAFRPRAPRRHKLFWEVFSSSLGAYIATAPILAYYFGTISLVAPLANVVILPIIPVIMLLGFVAALTGVLLPGSAFYLMQPVGWLVGLITDLIRLFAQLPHASELTVIGMTALLASYACLAVWAVVLSRRTTTIPMSRL